MVILASGRLVYATEAARLMEERYPDLKTFGLNLGDTAPMLPSDTHSSFAAIDVEKRAKDGRTSSLKVAVPKDGRITVQSVDVPSWEFFNLEKAVVRKRMAEAFSSVAADSPILFAAMPAGLASAELLPGRITARTFSKSTRFAADHIRNLENLRQLRLDPASAKFFNFVAPPPDGEASAKWERIRTVYDQTAASLRLPVGTGKGELLSTLEDGQTDVVVVVAHGDTQAIYLPDGSTLSVEDVLKLPPIAGNGKRPPVVVLLSCESGSAQEGGLTTMAEALMLRGRASAVIAPARQVTAGPATAQLLRDVVKSAEAGDLSGFMQRLKGPWQVIVEDTRSTRVGPG